MTVALILSVVALVAVSQPINMPFAPHPFQTCNLIKKFDGPQMLCCIPREFGSCEAPLNVDRRRLPPHYLPPPQYLEDVCCESTHTCCNKDEKAFLPRFVCCDSTEECTTVDSKGTCTVSESAMGSTPGVLQLEASGQCPVDGSLPARAGNGPRRCSFNALVTSMDCLAGSHCVRDNSLNANNGVCCRDTTKVVANVTVQIGCNKYSDCHSCVQNEDEDVGAGAQCGWLTQGSLSNNQPRCVRNCDNFPQKSCILPSSGNMCPSDAAIAGYVEGTNSTQVNTGTCARRCLYIGTGRAARINNIGNRAPVPVNASSLVASACCADFPGDYCCDHWGQVGLHCTNGRSMGSAMCGVPTKGTPNALYTPDREPLGPYFPAQGGTPWFQPYGNFPPYGQPYQGFSYYNPYGMPWWRNGENINSEADSKQLLFFIPPPMNRFPMPPNQQRRIPAVVNVNPSPFVCSCDLLCSEYQDCCSDYSDECVWADADAAGAGAR